MIFPDDKQLKAHAAKMDAQAKRIKQIQFEAGMAGVSMADKYTAIEPAFEYLVYFCAGALSSFNMSAIGPHGPENGYKLACEQLGEKVFKIITEVQNTEILKGDPHGNA